MAVFSFHRIFVRLILYSLIFWIHEISTPAAWAGSASVTKKDTPIPSPQRNHFTAPVPLTYGDESVIAPFQDTLLTADWDLDGDQDLICGSIAENYLWFENIGTAGDPKLKFRGALRCGENEIPVITAWRTKPGVGDFNGDGLPDLVGMNENRQLCWWPRYRDPNGRLRLAEPRCPVDSDGKTFTMSKGFRSTGRAKLVVCDWDHDGKPDIISSPPNFENIRHLRFFRNLGVKDDHLLLEFQPDRIILDPPNVEHYLEEFCGPWGHYYMGMPVDFNRDGLWEFISAVDMYGIYYWKE
jgi:hypothetical protein